jgi:hypothetical protein
MAWYFGSGYAHSSGRILWIITWRYRGVIWKKRIGRPIGLILQDRAISFYNYSAAGGQKVLIIALNKDNVDYFYANIKAIEPIQPSFTVVPA